MLNAGKTTSLIVVALALSGAAARADVLLQGDLPPGNYYVFGANGTADYLICIDQPGRGLVNSLNELEQVARQLGRPIPARPVLAGQPITTKPIATKSFWGAVNAAAAGARQGIHQNATGYQQQPILLGLPTIQPLPPIVPLQQPFLQPSTRTMRRIGDTWYFTGY